MIFNNDIFIYLQYLTDDYIYQQHTVQEFIFTQYFRILNIQYINTQNINTQNINILDLLHFLQDDNNNDFLYSLLN